MTSRENKPAKSPVQPDNPRLAAKALYDFAMIAKEMGGSEFKYDEELDAFRFRKDGRFVFSKEYADWQLLREHAYLR